MGFWAWLHKEHSTRCSQALMTELLAQHRCSYYFSNEEPNENNWQFVRPIFFFFFFFYDDEILTFLCLGTTQTTWMKPYLCLEMFKAMWMLCCSQRRQWLCLTDQLNPLEANKVQIWTKQLLFLWKKLSILRITSRQSDEQTQTCTQTDR